MSSLTDQSNSTAQFKKLVSELKNACADGIPHSEEIASLKGIGEGINPGYIQEVMTAGDIPLNSYLLGDFDPETSLVQEEVISAELEITKDEAELVEPVIEEPINTEGLTEKQIERENKKRERRQKRNEQIAKIKNRIKEKSEKILKKIQGDIEELEESADEQAAKIEEQLNQKMNEIQEGLKQQQSTLQNQLKNLNPSDELKKLERKEKAYNFFKAQTNECNKRISEIQPKIEELIEKCKEALELASEISKDQQDDIKKELKELQKTAENLKSQTEKMVPTFPAHPGPGNKANSSVTQKSRKADSISIGFEKNSEQQEKNVGDSVEEGKKEVKEILLMLLQLLAALLALIQFCLFITQLLEILMLSSLKKNSGLNENSNTASPEHFLKEIGYPGYGVDDFSKIIKNELNNKIPIRPKPYKSLSPSGDLSEPIILGDNQIGEPLTFDDINNKNKDFNYHPLLGDLSGINPQITNELYNDGVLPLLDRPALDPSQFDEDLNKLYDSILEDLVETNQLEYIDKFYNIEFEMIGYKRYKA